MSDRLTRMKKHRLRIMLIVGGAALLFGAAHVALREMRTPPLDSYRLALEAIEQVQMSAINATDVSEARRVLELGRRSMMTTSESWLPFASYRTADSLFRVSYKLAVNAAARGRDAQRKVRERAVADLSRLQHSVERTRRQLDDDLQRTNTEVLYRSLVFESDIAAQLIESGQYALSGMHLNSAFRLIDSIETLNRRYEQRGADGTAEWSRWVSETLAVSRSQSMNGVIVEKQSHRLFLIQNGRVVDSLVCDLGYNAGHQKMSAGDGATPEGRYRVVGKNEKSKYYRALLLNYPNEQDRQRFAGNVSSGRIPKNAAIGGLIEIHGHGGTGRDWTDGCVAVTNSDMDRLFRRLDVGAPVTIVREWRHRE